MSLGAIHHDRAVEHCHHSVRCAPCTERPLPFDVFLHQRNRERDTFEPSPRCQLALESAPVRTPAPPDAEPRPITRPEMPHTETIRQTKLVYEIPSSAMSGRLIDILL